MSRRMLSVYQYAGPLLLTPLSFVLWRNTARGDLRLTLTAWLVPIVYAYVVPGIGTNVLGLWEFDTRFRLGKFRPHHGFVFGSATSTLAWFCLPDQAIFADSRLGAFRTAFLLASVLGFWNVLYDIAAIRSGFLHVYNQPWAESRAPEAVVMDYAPWAFAGFGAIYGFGIGLAGMLPPSIPPNGKNTALFVGGIILLSLFLPVFGYVARSKRRHGHLGLRPAEKNGRR